MVVVRQNYYISIVLCWNVSEPWNRFLLLLYWVLFFLWLWLLMTSWFYPPCQPWPHLFGLLLRVAWSCHSHPYCLMPGVLVSLIVKMWRGNVLPFTFSFSNVRMHYSYEVLVILLWFLMLKTGSQVFSQFIAKKPFFWSVVVIESVVSPAALDVCPWTNVFDALCTNAVLYCRFLLSWNIFLSSNLWWIGLHSHLIRWTFMCSFLMSFPKLSWISLWHSMFVQVGFSDYSI